MASLAEFSEARAMDAHLDLDKLSQNELMKLLRLKEKNEEVLKKQVAALSTKERTLSYQCEQEQAAIRKLEQAKINGHAVRSSSEELEIEAVAELKRVEERVKLLTRAELYKDSLKDLAKSTLVDQIAEETANLKSAKDAIRALVGKKGIRKANEEVKKTQKK